MLAACCACEGTAGLGLRREIATQANADHPEQDRVLRYIHQVFTSHCKFGNEARADNQKKFHRLGIQSVLNDVTTRPSVFGCERYSNLEKF